MIVVQMIDDNLFDGLWQWEELDDKFTNDR
jgi:hypothetical protein